MTSKVSGQSHALVSVAPENEPLVGLPTGQETVSLEGDLGRRSDQKHPGPDCNRTSISNYKNKKSYLFLKITL
jgi:hypothetical protein